MRKIVVFMSISLDGYIEDVTGGIAFSEPDGEVHRFANQQTRETAAFLFGRHRWNPDVAH